MSAASGLPVVDLDGHVFEPDSLWEEHLDRAYLDRRPRLVHDERGTTRYLLDGRMIPAGTGRGAWVPEGIQEASAQREGASDESRWFRATFHDYRLRFPKAGGNLPTPINCR